MAFKFLTFAAVVAVAQAGLIASPAVTYQAAAPVAYAAAPIAKVAYAAQHEEYDANPQYSFSYGISDALTGDSKSQQESRSGDVVQGSVPSSTPLTHTTDSTLSSTVSLWPPRLSSLLPR
ncbi:hypothetical protein AND_000941 [Anopheles darlingi]|uniref:Secreted protein n=1 Tax=Anopheles darlingi TaxID=43151 RepID=W5JWA1_ANODA|nr:hypothetical protein AND_000941 [Anopheles darlingi]